MATHAMRLIQGCALRRESCVDRRQNFLRPFWGNQAGEMMFRSGRFGSREELLKFENCFDLHAGSGQLIFGDGKIDGGADAESFAGIARHGPLNGAIVLNPFEPRSVPDAREMYGSGSGDKIFGVAEIEREDGVANAAEGVKAGEAFVDRVGFDRIFEIADVFDLEVHVVELFAKD